MSSRDNDGLSRRDAYTLYFSHALSAWNARFYESAAIVFTAIAYPEGLRAASLLGLSNSVANVCFGPVIGHRIENAKSRLLPLLTSIAVNRVAVLLACLTWFLIVPNTTGEKGPSKSNADADPLLQGNTKNLAFTAIVVLGLIEGLSRNANMISMERDWVPVLALDAIDVRYSLTHVNSTMARIDMICKMASPVAVSWFFSRISSVRLGIASLALFNALSLSLEWVTAKYIYNKSTALQDRKVPQSSQKFSLAIFMSQYREGFRIYFQSKVWKASLAFCLTQASILCISGVMVVFLLDSGYSLRVVSVGQLLSAVFELSSTFIFPLAVKFIVRPGVREEFNMVPTEDFEEDLDEIDETAPRANQQAVARIGFWGIAEMALILVPTVPLFFYITSHLRYPVPAGTLPSTFQLMPALSAILILCLAASRIGRGTFALATQQLAQTGVAEHQRSAFAGTEVAFVSVFGMCHNTATTIWSKPEEFGWLSLGSITFLLLSAGLYLHWTLWDRKMFR